MPRVQGETSSPADSSGVKIESRFSARAAHDMFGKMKQVQKDVVSSIGFGPLFDIPNMKRTDRQLSIWLLQSWDINANVLRLDSQHEISISPSAVQRVLGIPNGSLPVTGSEDIEKSVSALRVKKILGLPGRSPMLSMTALEDMVFRTNIDTPDGKERFLAAFLLCIVAKFLAPRVGYARVQTEVYPAIVEPLRSQEYNWCGYVFDELRASAQKVQYAIAERLPLPVHGCILVLLVLYWDSLPVCRSIIQDNGTAPRATLYTCTAILSISELDPALTKLDKCRSFFEQLPRTQTDTCTDGRRRKRGRPRARIERDPGLPIVAVAGQGGVLSDAPTTDTGILMNAGTRSSALGSSSSAGDSTQSQSLCPVTVHRFGFQQTAIQPYESLIRITCNNWVLDISNPRLGPYADESAALLFWMTTNTQCPDYYWNWIEHFDQRNICMVGDVIRNYMLNIMPFDHDICEIAMRMFRKHEKKTCSNSITQPCRHFLSPDWARLVLSGALPGCEHHFSHMFKIDYTTYVLSDCNMVTTLIELDKNWSCYIWDFTTRRLTIVDPQITRSTIEEVKSRHYRSSAIFHSHFLLCMETYVDNKRRDILDWEITLFRDIIPAPNRDASALYALYYALEFDGNSMRVPATEERISEFRTALIYHMLHMDDNGGKVPRIHMVSQ